MRGSFRTVEVDVRANPDVHGKISIFRDDSSVFQSLTDSVNHDMRYHIEFSYPSGP